MWLQHLRCQLWIRTPLDLEVFLILKRPCVWGVCCADKAAWLSRCLAPSQSSLGSPVSVPAVREVSVWAATLLNRAGRHLHVAAAEFSRSTTSKTLQHPSLLSANFSVTHQKEKSFCIVLLAVLDFTSESRVGLFQTWGICCRNIPALCSSQPG